MKIKKITYIKKVNVFSVKKMLITKNNNNNNNIYKIA